MPRTELDDDLWRLLDAENPAERTGGADDHQDDGRLAGGDEQDCRDLRQREAAVDEDADDSGIERGDAGDLRCGEDAHPEADDDDDRHHEGPEGALELLPQPRGRKRAGGRVAAQPRHDGDDEHHGAGHDEARQEAGDENGAERHVRLPGVEHHQDRGRDDRPERAGGSGERRAEAAAVAARDELRHEHAGRRCAIGDRRPGDAGKEDVADDRGLSEAAADVPDERLREAEQALADAGFVHERAGERE